MSNLNADRPLRQVAFADIPAGGVVKGEEFILQF